MWYSIDRNKKEMEKAKKPKGRTGSHVPGSFCTNGKVDRRKGYSNVLGTLSAAKKKRKDRAQCTKQFLARTTKKFGGREVSPMDTVSQQGFGTGYRQSGTAFVFRNF